MRLSAMHVCAKEDEIDEGHKPAFEICRNYPTFSFVRSYEISSSR